MLPASVIKKIIEAQLKKDQELSMETVDLDENV